MSPEELKAILETSGDLIPTRYQDMLLSILELDKISIEEVMTQRSEIIGIDLSDDFNEILEQLQKNLPHGNLHEWSGLSFRIPRVDDH